jgi:hypothetical protein
MRFSPHGWVAAAVLTAIAVSAFSLPHLADHARAGTPPAVTSLSPADNAGTASSIRCNNNGGNSAGISIANSASLNITGPLTIALWVKSAPPSPWSGTFLAASGPGGYAVGVNTGTYYLPGVQSVATGHFGFYSSAYGKWVEGKTSITDNQWHHVAVVVSGITATFYLDGVPDGTALTLPPASHTGTYWSICGFYTGAQAYSIGQMDDLQIYNRALPAADVSQLYNNGLGYAGAVGTGLAAGWHFDENGGATASDYSGNSNNGDVYNMTWLPSPVAPSSTISATAPSPQSSLRYCRRWPS